MFQSGSDTCSRPSVRGAMHRIAASACGDVDGVFNRAADTSAMLSTAASYSISSCSYNSARGSVGCRVASVLRLYAAR